jgi:hypothetical protein
VSSADKADKHRQVNLFPRSHECTRKDCLSRNIARLAYEKNSRLQYESIMPECYVLPGEKERLLLAFQASQGAPWIV